jgi:arylsulfatase A
MKPAALLSVPVLITSCFGLSITPDTQAMAPRAEALESLPSVVIVYGDDVGYGDVGAYGAEKIPTPNIDRLAAEGIRFTDGQCTSATCTPSRFSMLTGVHGFREGIGILPPNAPLTIPTDILTLPHIFKKAGYRTGVVGKWHLGLGAANVPTDWNGEVKPGPLEIGFDYSFLLPSTNDRVPCVYLENHRVVNLDPDDPLYVGRSLEEIRKHSGSTQYPDGKTNPEAMTYYPSSHGHNNSVINGIGRIGYMAGGKSALWNDETMADVFVGQAKAFMERNRDQPFFLFFPSQDIHVPRAPHPRFQGKSGRSYRGDAMVQLDWATGEIMNTLEELGLAENTIVIFSSDNGPVYDDGYDDGTTVKRFDQEVDRGHDASGIWRGGKYQIYEGGTRVPFIIRWPARIKPGVSDALVSQVDFLASFANLLGVEVPETEARDSRDTLKAFLGEDPQGLPYLIEEARGHNAIRVGDWKYIPAYRNMPEGLFHLVKDPSEQNNVVQDHPEKAKEFATLLARVESGDGLKHTSP